MRSTLSLILIPLTALPVLADQGLPGVIAAGRDQAACFTRTYTDAELARTPGQKTRAMRVLIRDEPNVAGGAGRGYSVRIEVQRRGASEPVYALGICDLSDSANKTVVGTPVIKSYKKAKGIGCMMLDGPDTEGGYVILDSAGGNLMLHTEDAITMTTAARSGITPKSESIPFGRDDNVFRLAPAPASTCADLPARRLDFRN